MDTTHNIIAAALFGVALAAGCTSLGDRTLTQDMSDSEITTKVKAKFVADNTVGALDIHVATHEGAVQLSGTANNPYEIKRASDIAWHTQGVKLVMNDIRLQ